jgi:23S rRNA (adenine2503-C2)-methyltransferase
LAHFHPDRFLLKITPLNPTYQAERHGLSSYIDPVREDERYGIVEALKSAGYQVLVSIGEPEENRIGSNCGQYLRKHLEAADRLAYGYGYDLRRIPE